MTFGRPPDNEAPQSHAHSKEEDVVVAAGGHGGRGPHRGLGQLEQAADLWKECSHVKRGNQIASRMFQIWAH